MSPQTCPTCKGKRLKPETLAVKINGKSIIDVCDLSIANTLKFIDQLTLNKQEVLIARRIIKEIKERLGFLIDVGLDYLTLERSAGTLSGGEGQRIRLATQIGSSLVGVLYVLDEPSIGLHQRDNQKLLDTLKRLRDLGNTVIVVEHDQDTMMAADFIVDLGPEAGEKGGEIVAIGTPEEILANPKSLTGQYLSGKTTIPVPQKRREGNGKFLEVLGATQHNLKNIDIKIPLGKFTCLTGVSGSGKSTVLLDIVYKALAQRIWGASDKPGDFREIRGVEFLDKVVDIDQSPIGRTPRSNPATYTGLFTLIRELFTQLPEAKVRGYKAGRFSFNVINPSSTK